MANLYELLGKRVVILDFETTGLNPAIDHVIEIAAIRWDHEGRREFQTIVRLDLVPKPLDSWVTERSGITREMIDAGADPIIAFNTLIQSFLYDAEVIVGHNVAFDLSFLRREARWLNMGGEWTGDFIDTRALALFTKTGIERQNNGGYMMLGTKLEEVAKALGLKLHGAHRAMADVLATEAILPHLYRRALEQQRPIYNALTHAQWLVAKGKAQPDYVPPRALVYRIA